VTSWRRILDNIGDKHGNIQENVLEDVWKNFCSSSGVGLAERLSRFDKEALTFEVFLAKRAVEALGVVVVVQSLDPPVSGFDRESAGDALCCEQLVPIFFTVGKSVLQIEGAVGEDLVAVGARKALGVEVCRHRLQAVPDNLFSALAAVRR